VDWLEQLLGFSPDGGNGLAEVVILLVAASIVTLVVIAVARWRRV
jgi:hypothetical protein